MKMMSGIEIWKDIPGYNRMYQVSNLGRCKSFKKNREIILKQPISNSGYCRVRFYSRENKESKAFSTHRIVLSVFDRYPLKGEVCNHINGNKLDNSIHNLEWCTISQNAKHAHDLGLISQEGEKNPASNISNKLCEEIVEDLLKGINYQEILKKYKILKRTTLSNINRGLTYRNISSQYTGNYPMLKNKRKLSRKDVLEVLRLRQDKYKITEIAEKFSVSKSLIERVLYV